MGGVIGPKPSSPAPAPAPAPKPEPTKVTRSEEEAGARMRGARRRGRSLLSDTRLSGEMGVETLGGGSNLG